MEPARIKSLSLVTLLILLIITGYAFVGQVFDLKKTEYSVQWGATISGPGLILVTNGGDGFTCTSIGGVGVVTPDTTDGSIRLLAAEGASYSCTPATSSHKFFLSSPFYGNSLRNLGQNNLTLSAGLNSVSLFVIHGESDDDDENDPVVDPFANVQTIGLSNSFGPNPTDSIYITFSTPTIYSTSESHDINGGVAGVSLTCLLLASGLVLYLLYLEYQAARYPESFATV